MPVTITVDQDRSNNQQGFTEDPLLQDESAGTQPSSNPTDDGNEVDVVLSGTTLIAGSPALSSGFLSYLNAKLNLTQKQFVAANDAAQSIPTFITATPSGGEKISDLFFTLDPANATGLVSGVTTLLNEPVYLHIDSNNNFAYVSTSSSAYDPNDSATGRLVAAFAMVSETKNAQTGVYTAGVETATFEGLLHGTAGDPDEPINWSDTLRVSASSTTEINFNAVPSGDFLWVSAGSSGTGVLVTSDTISVDGATKKTNTNEDIHTSKGGGQVTIGVVNQLFDHNGETAVFTLVKNLSTLSSSAGAGGDYLVDPTGDNKDQGINYGDANTNLNAYQNTTGSGFYLSQSQGTPTTPKDIDINVYRAGGGTTAEDGSNYATGLNNDTPVNVGSVTILNGTTEVGTWVAGADPDGAGPLLGSGATAPNSIVKVTINGNNIDVNGVNVNYTINWTAANGATFNRFTVTDETFEVGSSYYNANNDHIGAFDIGKILLANTDTAFTGLGSHLFVEDSAPKQTTATAQVAVGEDYLNPALDNTDLSTGISDSGAGDTKTDKATFTAASIAAIIDAGTDQPAIITLNSSFNGTQAVQVVTNSGLANLFSHGDQVFFNSASATEITGVANGRIVFRLTAVTDVNNVVTGYQFDLEDQLDHPDASGENANLTVDLSSAFKMTDKDLDPITLTGSVITALVENDVPAAVAGATVTNQVHEDALTGGNTPDGDSETKTLTATITSTDLNTLVTSGADDSMSFSLNTATGVAGAIIGENVMTVGDNAVLSSGQNVKWAAGASGSLKGVATINGVETTIFTLAPSGSSFVFTLVDQVDHSGAESDSELLGIDLTSAFKGVDFDKDPVTFIADSIIMNVENDLPVITAQIASKTLDWAKDNFVTSTLNGRVGGDDSASYSIDKYTDLAGYTETLTNGGRTLTYVKDSDGKTYFTLQLDDAGFGGTGGYTFTVNQPPPQSTTHFSFLDMPSGQNLQAVIAKNKANVDLNGLGGADDTLPDGGILVMPTNPVLDANGVYIPKASGTINTSQGGGNVTIGNGNQAFDKPGDGAWFIFVDNPLKSDVGGYPSGAGGIDQNTADDADSIGFTGFIESRDSSVKIVQASGGGKQPGPEMHITTYESHITGTVGGSTTDRAFVDDPTAANLVGSNPEASQVNIVGVVIKNANGDIIETRILDQATGDAVLVGSANSTVDIRFNLDDPKDGSTTADDIYSAFIKNLAANYTVEFLTATDHNMAKVEWVSGSFDIGGFDLIQGNDTPDINFEFSIAIQDKDADLMHYGGSTQVVDDFRITVDGTGVNNQDPNVDPLGFTSSYDSFI